MEFSVADDAVNTRFLWTIFVMEKVEEECEVPDGDVVDDDDVGISKLKGKQEIPPFPAVRTIDSCVILSIKK